MKKLNNLFTLLSALLLLGACEKDGDTYFLSQPGRERIDSFCQFCRTDKGDSPSFMLCRLPGLTRRCK